MGKREENRREIRAAEYEAVLENLDFLGDPFDMMDLGTKKQHALSLYYKILKVMSHLLFVCFILLFVCLVVCSFVCSSVIC